MSMTSSEMTPADIAAVTNCGNANGSGWGGAWGEWILIFLIFAVFGWGGNNGWGNGGSGGGASSGYVLASDFATLQRQIDSGIASLERKGDAINSGLCDGFYAMNSSLLNGFAGVNSNMSTQGYETRNAITQAQIAQMQSANALQAQLAQCCCDTRASIADVNYNMALGNNGIQQAISNGFCQTNFNSQTNTRDIVDSQNASTQAILAKLSQMETSAKDEKIAEQAQQISALQFAASQAAQNTYLVNQLRPCPSPAYVVPNPYCCNTGYNNCCGCNA